jgi:hypothetical protein
MTRRKRTAFLAVLAAVCAVTIGAVATGAAPLGTGPALSDVPTANTKSPGFSPASKLSAAGGAALVPWNRKCVPQS